MSLAEQVERQLLELLRSYQPGDRFLSETDIVNRFRVSRVTIREALTSLKRQGLITRKQGLGTFVSSAPRIHSQIDQSTEFSTLIRASGQTASVAETSVHVGPTRPAIAACLRIAPADPVLAVSKIFSAGSVPVIYVINTIPLHLIPPELRERIAQNALATEPVYTFLAECCGHPVAYQVAEVRAVRAGRPVARVLNYHRDRPIINIEETGYSAGDLPVFFSQEYYNTDVIQFRLLRRPN